MVSQYQNNDFGTIANNCTKKELLCNAFLRGFLAHSLHGVRGVTQTVGDTSNISNVLLCTSALSETLADMALVLLLYHHSNCLACP